MNVNKKDRIRLGRRTAQQVGASAPGVRRIVTSTAKATTPGAAPTAVSRCPSCVRVRAA